MELSNLCLSSISQSTAPVLNKSVPTDQEQLQSVCNKSDVVFDSMDKLARDLLTWQELQINQDSIASVLHQNSPEKLHEHDITTIKLECLDNYLSRDTDPVSVLDGLASIQCSERAQISHPRYHQRHEAPWTKVSTRGRAEGPLF